MSRCRGFEVLGQGVEVTIMIELPTAQLAHAIFGITLKSRKLTGPEKTQLRRVACWTLWGDAACSDWRKEASGRLRSYHRASRCAITHGDLQNCKMKAEAVRNDVSKAITGRGRSRPGHKPHITNTHEKDGKLPEDDYLGCSSKHSRPEKLNEADMATLWTSHNHTRKRNLEVENKNKYPCLVHSLNLKQALAHSLVLVKIHRVLKFSQPPWLKGFIMIWGLIQPPHSDFLNW